jgi:hypothetical protein
MEWSEAPPYYYVTLYGAGEREFTFRQGRFTRALENFLRPLIRDKRVGEVIVDGHAASAMFYSAANGSDLAHIKVLRLFAIHPNYIRVPRHDILLPSLERLMLDCSSGHSSRMDVDTLSQIVSRIKSEARLKVSLRKVFVYGHADGLLKYADIADGEVRRPSWSPTINQTLA